MPYITTYASIGFFALVSAVLSIVILGASYLLSNSYSYTEKLSTYECGFDPYDDARNAFDVRFYLVAILFIIFDIETVFLLPFASTASVLPSSANWYILDFFVELCIGYGYAWKVKALDWS
jgi:NADH-quinone oxidoreductase subunit A